MSDSVREKLVLVDWLDDVLGTDSDDVRDAYQIVLDEVLGGDHDAVLDADDAGPVGADRDSVPDADDAGPVGADRDSVPDDQILRLHVASFDLLC